MTISILHPSYGRPLLALDTAIKWMQRASGQVEYLLCVSKADPLLEKYEEYFAPLKNVTVYYHYQANMVKQVNFIAREAAGNLLIDISDDFDCPNEWDILLRASLEGKEDYIVKTDDGIRVKGINSDNIIALPIMDRKYYNRFGYIYHPDYNHFFGDEELSNVGDILGRKITLPIVFEHIHYVMGKAREDATNKKNNKYFDIDKATFARRKAVNFGL